MDQAKIGRFIALCRKEQGLTQMQLAEKLNITDRAVSKWENGRTMPDSSIMLELCGIFGISANDLLSGERVEMDKEKERLEEHLIEMVRQKEAADRQMLTLEIVIGVLSVILMLGLIIVTERISMADWLKAVLIAAGFIQFIIAMGFALRIEQTAGYYRCARCGHRYVPTYSRVLWALHAGRTRYMKCTRCGRYSWQKKVISKD